MGITSGLVDLARNWRGIGGQTFRRKRTLGLSAKIVFEGQKSSCHCH